jgi:MFS family permease
MKSHPFALLRQRNARLYVAALAPSLFGDSAMLLVAGIWAKELTGSSSTATLVTFALWAPSLISPVIGLLADRFHRLRLVVAVNSVMAGWICLLLTVHDSGDVWRLFVVIVGYGFAYAVVDPAESALFTSLVPAESLGELNGLRFGLQEGCKLLAPAAGAALFVWDGARFVVVLDAVSFALAAVLMLRLRITDAGGERRGRDGAERPWATVTAGMRHIAAAPELRRALLGSAAGMFALGLSVSMSFAVIDQGLHRPPSFLGVTSTVLGAASLVGGVLSPVVLRALGERRTAALGLMVLAVAMAATALPSLVAVLGGSMLRGLGAPAVSVATVTLVQRRTPDAVLGRTMAAAGTLTSVPVTTALALGAGLLTVMDYRVVLACCVALCGVGSAGVLGVGVRVPAG